MAREEKKSPPCQLREAERDFENRFGRHPTPWVVEINARRPRGCISSGWMRARNVMFRHVRDGLQDPVLRTEAHVDSFFYGFHACLGVISLDEWAIEPNMEWSQK